MAKAGPTDDAEQQRSESSAGALDPQIYLRGGSPAKTLLSIIEFLNLVPTASDEQVVSEDDGKQMGLRSTSRKPKLQNVAIEEWTLANMRTMDALIAEGVIFAAGIRDYMSYTIKICELFCCYDRASVLQYDQKYRHLQSIYGYR